MKVGSRGLIFGKRRGVQRFAVLATLFLRTTPGLATLISMAIFPTHPNSLGCRVMVLPPVLVFLCRFSDSIGLSSA